MERPLIPICHLTIKKFWIFKNFNTSLEFFQFFKLFYYLKDYYDLYRLFRIIPNCSELSRIVPKCHENGCDLGCACIPKASFERLNSFLFEIVSRAPNSLLLFMFFPRSDWIITKLKSIYLFPGIFFALTIKVVLK